MHEYIYMKICTVIYMQSKNYSVIFYANETACYL